MSQKEDALYQRALSYLQRGFDQKRIADTLVQDGMSREDALNLSARVWKENGSSRSANAKILLGFGGFLVFLGISFIVIRYLSSGEIPPILSPSYFCFIVAAYLFFKGWRDLQSSQSPN